MKLRVLKNCGYIMSKAYSKTFGVIARSSMCLLYLHNQGNIDIRNNIGDKMK